MVFMGNKHFILPSSGLKEVIELLLSSPDEKNYKRDRCFFFFLCLLFVPPFPSPTSLTKKSFLIKEEGGGQ